MSIILEANNLNKEYQTDKNISQQVLKNVCLKVEEGEFVAVMGPSGSGKSTLLYNISGMDAMTSGKVAFQGQDISSLTEEELSVLRRDRMGFIFQQSHLLKNLNLFDNIILSSYLGKNQSRSQINQRCTELMEKAGISELADKNITQASGGQLQRVSICRALMNNPDIIFGDEPTGALNSRAAAEVMELLTEVNRENKTVLIVTHDAKVAAQAERIVFMLDGCIVSEKYMGKYQKEENNLKNREEALSSWLMKEGW